MSENTKIEWATGSWNPWIGCTKVSPGCANCYAEHSAPTRTVRAKGRELWGNGKPRQRTSASYWKQTLKWNREAGLAAGEAAVEQFTHERPRVFPSLCDWLDDEVPIEWLADFLKLMHDTPNLSWLNLTKRPENFFSRLRLVLYYVDKKHESKGDQLHHDRADLEAFADWLRNWLAGNPPKHVWIGASAEDQPRLDQRVPELLKIPAAVRFLSCEPLIGPLDFPHAAPCGYYCDHDEFGGGHRPGHGLSGIHWVIVGGESGPRARPCNVEWLRDIVRQCKAAGVPCFVKQLGSNAMQVFGAHGSEAYATPMILKHPKGGEPSEWPEDLRVREFPIPEATMPVNKSPT